MNKPTENPFETAPGKIPVIKVIGLGGAGCNVLQHLTATSLASSLQLIAVDTDARGVAQFSKGLLLGQKLTRGLGTGGDPEVGRAAAMAQTDDLKEICNGADIVFVMAGLGGGLSTGAVTLVAQ